MKILILRFSSIGDIILTSPVVRCLKQQLPGVEIHYATKRSYASLVETNPYIDKCHFLDDNLNAFIAQLRPYAFDHIVDLHHNLRTSRIKAKLKVHSASFKKLNIEKWLMVNFKWDKLPHVHIVDRYMGTVKQFNVHYDGNGLDFFIPNDTSLPDGLPANYLVYAIGGQKATKKMPAEKISELCGKIPGVPIVLLGDRKDAEQAEFILKSNPHVISYCGKLSLFESALVIKNAYAVISHDSGLMHISAALDKRILSVWGNTIPEFGMYPFFKNDSTSARSSQMFEVKAGCRPCSKIGFNKCPRGHFKCMKNQDVDAIIGKLKADVRGM